MSEVLRARMEALMRMLVDSGDATPQAQRMVRRVLDEEASEAKIADAWDEGYEDGVLDGQARGSGAPGEHETPNPHRQANDELRIRK